MDEPAPEQPQHRRRRRRATARQGPPPAASTPEVPAQAPKPTAKDERRKPRRKPADQQARGGTPRSDLAGAVRSQVGVSGALRARDVNRPSEADLAAAEAELVVVRRNWRPDDTGGPSRHRT